MTLRHVVAWRLTTDDPHARAEQAQRIADELGSLAGVVPSLLAVSVGPDLVGEGNWDVALVADFADRAGLDAYQAHPAHRAAGDYIRSVVSDRVAVDYEV